jgi:hypothetical protein
MPRAEAVKVMYVTDFEQHHSSTATQEGAHEGVVFALIQVIECTVHTAGILFPRIRSDKPS